MSSFSEARMQEVAYHEQLYKTTALFEPGTWLAKPVAVVLELLEELPTIMDGVRVLDLGCGIGRNSIPVAQRIQADGGSVVGVDLLPIATQKMLQNAARYNVQVAIHAEVSDVEFYEIEPNAYDYVIACSCLEHLPSRAAFETVVKRMIAGTKENGIHCLLLSTEVSEQDHLTGETWPGRIELNLATEEAIQLLSELYQEWDVLITRHVPQSVGELKNGRKIEFKSNWLTFAARKRQEAKQSVNRSIRHS
ncbi:methyltransferase family protein [Paenibacillus taihuensis]|uniref:Methyltransferase family protein n=1 Tax=Paenibacillus taihuensis TaxID=1156355 RepID=A0A3D9QTL8_9BACL|nr:class I SAM-dependent methyltransferase [Paenibacillus taihuensis]REE66635.1 methyltransferase family protein [Paenibacillus taihuensis]